MRRDGLVLFLICVLAVAAASCGGDGNSSSGGKTDPPPLITVGLTCAASTVDVGGTTQCTSSITPAGASAVNLTASAGTITSAGMFTAPAILTGTGDSMPVTVTATATVNPASTATATVTVERTIDLTSIAPYLYWPTWRGGFMGVPVQATGLAVGDQVGMSPIPGILSGLSTIPGGMSLALGMGEGSISPGWWSVSAKSADGSISSNTLSTVLVGGNNILAVCSDRIAIVDESGYLPGTAENLNGVIHEYAFDGAPLASFRAGDYTSAIGCDKPSDEIVTTQLGYTPSGDIVSTMSDPSNGAPLGVATSNGNFCLLLYGGLSGCGGPVTAFAPSFTQVATGTTPASIAMADASNIAQVYASGSNDLWFVTAPDATVQGHASLAGIVTPVANLQPGQGGWPGVVFGSGSRAGYSALLSIPDQKLVIAIGGAVSSTIDLAPVAPKGATAIMAVADEPLGVVIVGFADDAAQVGRFVEVDPLTGTITPLSVTSVSAPVGMGVSADGKTLYVGSRDQPPDILAIQ